MPISFPFDLLAEFPGWSTEFELLRREEQSRTAGGVSVVKDLGEPLWQAAYATTTLSPNDLDYWRARLDVLDGGQQQFRAYPLSRCFPIAYPNGSWPAGTDFDGDNATLTARWASNKEMTVSGLPPFFIVSAGDFLRIGGRNLHRAVNRRVADGSGVLGGIEVRPHFWPETAVGDAVSVRKPYCLMTVVSGSISTTADLATGRGSISFRAIEAR
ncbi:hypothetical protein SAMN05892877_105357 [Rhizobium subbaraonis]|uniref:Uncharacterized protein n=1 Tax=Rhizobium subbaraonis TaxID=908946 RepID=A0A285UAM9_9HYPH|nr:hypothetical protein [Rhizobium subbaraonis]SOC38975.1 hypothetical protein SAMN05892877_105357 [Rhizobium subbaraonis]